MKAGRIVALVVGCILEFEVMWLVPPEHWGEAENQAIIDPLDLAAERRRFAEHGLT